MLLRLGKFVWIALAILVLVVALNGFDGAPNSDIGVFLVWSLLVLAFPISLLVALCFAAVHELVSSTIPITAISSGLLPASRPNP